jgi:tetratricopeptide (TPR) repeat protein
MKICPFISHMIGEDEAGILEIHDESMRGSASDDGDAAGAPRSTAHLFCLKDTCRFYRRDAAECSFDVVFERVEAQARSLEIASQDDTAATTRKSLEKVNKELEKFWALQTRSVAELVESIGETEKNTRSALDGVEKKIADAVAARDKEGLDAIRQEISRLYDASQSREEGMEELSSTVSEMMMTFEDRLAELRDHSGQLTSRLEKLESSLPAADDLREWIRESLSSASDESVSEGVRTLQEQLDVFVNSNTDFENRLREWQQRIDERVDEIHDGRTAWAERLGESMRSAEGETEALAERRKRSRKLNNLGVTSFHNGELELARDQFLEATSLDEGFAECYNNLGLVYTELGEDERATEAFSTAVKINPDLHAAYNNLGYVFYKQGSYDQAIEMYNEALGRNASNSSAYTNLGNACYKQGKVDEARSAWEKALELDPSNRRADLALKRLDGQAKHLERESVTD